ncbi:MAG TPA: response regulator transcription factor [Gammaproteobacteria bacterium]
MVHIVDDDAAVRDALALLLRTVRLPCRTYASADEFLSAYTPRRVECLVADVRMPGLSGLELQQELAERHLDIPIIFITGHGDIPMAVKTMKSGAIDFIQKPFRDQDLLDRIHQALQIAQSSQDARREISTIQERVSRLTPREREVMDKVVKGCANKVIAMDLGVSQRTVELHRARVMQKMGARSLAELVRFAQKI